MVTKLIKFVGTDNTQPKAAIVVSIPTKVTIDKWMTAENDTYIPQMVQLQTQYFMHMSSYHKEQGILYNSNIIVKPYLLLYSYLPT